MRVSKNDESQTPENQREPLRKMAESLGAEVVGKYQDFASGGNSNRPQFQQMLEDANCFLNFQKNNARRAGDLIRHKRRRLEVLLEYFWLQPAQGQVKPELWLNESYGSLGKNLFSLELSWRLPFQIVPLEKW